MLLTVVAVDGRHRGDPAPARRRRPRHVSGLPLLIVAAVGLVANLVAFLILRGGDRDSLNMRGAYLEVLGDLFGSIAALVAGVVILTTGFARADAIASLLIAALIVPRAVLLLRDVVRVLTESAPRETDVDQIREHLLETPGVVDVHDVHVWAITSGAPVFTAHVECDARSSSGRDRRDARPARRVPEGALRCRALDVPARAVGHAGTRSMPIATSGTAVEDYLKAIYATPSGSPIRSAVAARAAARARSELGHRDGEEARRAGSWSTRRTGRSAHASGRTEALRMVRRHRLVETWLVQQFGYGWDEVHDEAEVLEHTLSDRLLDAIDAQLGRPTRDPHGDPIPAADLSMPRVPTACRAATLAAGSPRPRRADQRPRSRGAARSRRGRHRARLGRSTAGQLAPDTAADAVWVVRATPR